MPKKIACIILSVITLVSIYSQTALAAPERLYINSATNNIEFYDTNATCSTESSGTDLSSVSPGSGAPNGMTYPNLDATKMADAIEKYIETHAPDSPLKGTSQKAVASAKKANLSPFLAYAHAMMESTLATTDVPGAQIKVHQGHNAFGRTATDSQPHVVEASRNWYMWTSFEASVDADAEENKNVDSGDWFSYDRAVFSDEIDQGMTAYANRYAPPDDGNDTEGYINFMQGALDEMAGYAGASVATTSTTSTTSSSSSSSNCCVKPKTGGSVVKMLSDNPETALGYLMSAGNGTKLTLAQAAGIVGNLQQESGPTLDPRASNGSHIGIAQWDEANRWNNGLVKFAADMGSDPYDFSIQLRYLAWEMGLTDEWKDHTPGRGGTADAVRATTSAEQATEVFEANFEGSGGSAMEKRQAYAKALYEKYKDSPTLGSSSGTSEPGTSASCSSGGGASSSLQEYTLKYAWPQIHHEPRIQRKDEYIEAIYKATDEGRFFGSHYGVDCGGFVTTLIYDSGFDKTYNFDAKGGNTVVQRLWATLNWQYLGSANGTYEPDGSKFTDDKLQPGDVAFSPGHTWIYVGEINGFESKYASASQGEKAPSAGGEGFDWAGAVWFRKKSSSSTTTSSGISA